MVAFGSLLALQRVQDGLREEVLVCLLDVDLVRRVDWQGCVHSWEREEGNVRWFESCEVDAADVVRV